jgi:hypothetical protein
MRVSLRGLYPRYTLLSVLLCHLPPMESSADDRLWPDASVRRNTPAEQMTPFGVFREGWGRATVMHLPVKEGWFDARLVTDARLANPEPENWLMTRGNYKGWSYSALDQINTHNVKNSEIREWHKRGGFDPHHRSVSDLRNLAE